MNRRNRFLLPSQNPKVASVPHSIITIVRSNILAGKPVVRVQSPGAEGVQIVESVAIDGPSWVGRISKARVGIQTESPCRFNTNNGQGKVIHNRGVHLDFKNVDFRAQPVSHPVWITVTPQEIQDIQTKAVIATISEGYRWYWAHGHLHIAPADWDGVV